MGTYFFKTNLMGMRALQPPGKHKENEGGYGENKVSRWFANIILFSFAILITASSDYSSGGVPEQPSTEATAMQTPRENVPSAIKETYPGKKTKEDFCDAVNRKFMQLGWYKIICDPNRWEIFHYSSRGNPVVYQEFGFDDPDNKGPVNLVLCGVHGDEPTGIYPCFYLVRDILFDNPQVLKDFKIIIAPIVNPDGFFANTRQNGNGVDPNRNLPTKDWASLAQKTWLKEEQKDPRKFPGERGGSEVESELQTYLINRYKPDKIFSVHAPLGFLDFDGPGKQKHINLSRTENRAKYLVLNLEANTNNFLQLKDYRVFPGSLGNYAGKERNIPTYTVEFQTTEPSSAHYLWSVLRYALVKALSFTIYDEEDGEPPVKVYHIREQEKFVESQPKPM